MYGKDTIPLPVFNKDQKHAKGAARLVRSSKVPHGNLTHVNQIWQTEHNDDFVGFSYKSINRTTYAEQKLGLIMTTAISNQILRAYKRIKTRPAGADDQIKIGSFC